MKQEDKSISRRSFIGKTIAGLVGAAVSARAGATPAIPDGDARKEPGLAAKKPSIRDYRPLGRTGWRVSDISFGNASMRDPALLEYAMERGVNYVDTARQYYDMEKVIGKLFPAKRDKLFVTTKLMPEIVTPTVGADEIMKGIEESLERLNTDYIDCCMIHSVGDPNLGGPERVQNPELYEAFAAAKKQGKIRFWGASSHGPEMVRDFEWLLDNTEIDLIMPGMNYLTSGLEPVLAKARKKGVAVVAMKSLSTARKIDFSAYENEGRTIRQALIKWMLARPDIDTIAITMRTFEEVDEFVAASGSTDLGMKESRILERYASRATGSYCRPGCGACLNACPHGVPVHDILRYELYFDSYEREKYAMGLYAALPEGKRATRCRSCAGPCGDECPYGLNLRDRLMEAHETLTI